MLTLKNRVAVVTGGSRGLGFHIAQRMAEYGMEVAILSSKEENIRKAVEKFNKNQLNVKGIVCNVAKVDEIEITINEIFNIFGRIDVLVNCAGILDKCNIGDLTETEWSKVIDVNLKGTFFMVQKSIKYLEKSDYPRIINISSNAGRMGGYENGLAYTASKGGIIALTYGMARRLASKGITVNCVAPGTIESDMSAQYDNLAMHRLLDRFPIGRIGKPSDIVEAVCYFASEEAGFTTGAVLDVNGGLFMG